MEDVPTSFESWGDKKLKMRKFERLLDNENTPSSEKGILINYCIGLLWSKFNPVAAEVVSLLGNMGTQNWHNYWNVVDDQLCLLVTVDDAILISNHKISLTSAVEEDEKRALQEQKIQYEKDLYSNLNMEDSSVRKLNAAFYESIRKLSSISQTQSVHFVKVKNDLQEFQFFNSLLFYYG